ncbi:MAG: NAD(P)H-quinone oxidoreductase [Devosia sp.]|nr:NAD(P)H-quinone oxidoreductase [Devosia sp.]
MRAVIADGSGGPEVLRFIEQPRPGPAAGQVLVKVAAASINRPDVSQRRGVYPPPPGVTDILGLDLAGTIIEVGEGVTRWKVGDRVCCLVQGGAYAQYCSVPQEQVLPIPDGFDFIQAAALPEIFFTAWNNLLLHGRMQPGETLLVQGGTSGVGMAAIQIAKLVLNATVVATAGTDEKRAVCLALGADAAIDYKHPEWDVLAAQASGRSGFDLILDSQAGDYTARHLAILRDDGRLVLIATHRGSLEQVDLMNIQRRRLILTGSTIRPRSSQYKAGIAASLEQRVWPLLSNGSMKVLIHSVFGFEDVAAAHALLDRNEQIGKVVMTVEA